MKKIGILTLVSLPLMFAGCARPFELGYTPAYTTKERINMIARNWDYEGKQSQDDIDHILMLRPASRLTVWEVR